MVYSLNVFLFDRRVQFALQPVEDLFALKVESPSAMLRLAKRYLSFARKFVNRRLAVSSQAHDLLDGHHLLGRSLMRGKVTQDSVDAENLFQLPHGQHCDRGFIGEFVHVSIELYGFSSVSIIMYT